MHESCTPESDSHEIVTVGVPREAMDFLARAVKAGHPRTVAVHLSETIKQVLRMNFGGDVLFTDKRAFSFSLEMEQPC